MPPYVYSADGNNSNEHRGDGIHVLLTTAFNLLELGAILVDNDGRRGGDAEVLLGGGVLFNVDFIGVGVADKLGGVSSKCSLAFSGL